MESNTPAIDSLLAGNPDAGQATPVAQNAPQSSSSTPAIDSFLNDEKFGTVGQGAKAFAEHAANTATFGGSTLAETKLLGVNPQDIQARTQAHPVASVAGDLTGIGASLLVAPEFSPVGAVSKLGQGVEEAVAAGKLAEGASTADKVLNFAQNVGARSLGSAVEGSLYSGIGNSITEDALNDGDHQLTGEQILSNFGYGGLYGGLIGGALKTAGYAVPAAVGAARDALGNLKDVLIGTGEGDAGIIGKGLNAIAPNSKLSDLLSNRVSNLDEGQGVKAVQKITDNLNDVQNNINTSLKDFNTNARPEEVDALINTANPERVKAAAQGVMTGIDSAAQAMRAEPELYTSSAARKLELIRDGLNKNITPDSSPTDIFNSLRDAKQQLNNIVFSKMPNAQEQESIQLLNGLRKELNTTLKNPDNFGDVGSRLAAHDDILSDHYSFVPPSNKTSTPFAKTFLEKTGSGPNTSLQFSAKKMQAALKRMTNPNNIQGEADKDLLDSYFEHLKTLPDHMESTYQNIPNENWDSSKLKNIIENSENSTQESLEKFQDIRDSQKSGGSHALSAIGLLSGHGWITAGAEAINAIKHPEEYINQLAQVERSINKVSNGVNIAAKAIFSTGSKAVDATTGLLAGRTSESRLSNYEKDADLIMNMTNNVQGHINSLAENTQELHNIAPQTAAAVQQAGVRATQFLASKLPQPTQTGQFDQKYEPSQTEINKFNRYKEIVDNPLVALKQIKYGTITPEAVEALSVVYPKLYNQMKQTVSYEANLMTKNGTKPIPNQVRLGLSMFLGQPITQGYKPVNVIQNQLAFAPKAPPQTQSAPKASKTGIGKVKVADRISLSPDND